MSQDSWTMRKGKTRISWVWRMRNDHYGVRKKTRKQGKWGMKQDLAEWKFRTLKSNGNIYSKFEDKFGALLRVHFIHTMYRFEAWKSRVQRFKGYSNWSWNEEVRPFEDKCTKLNGHFAMISKFTSKWPQFRIHPLSLWCFTSSTSGIASRALYPP